MGQWNIHRGGYSKVSEGHSNRFLLSSSTANMCEGPRSAQKVQWLVGEQAELRGPGKRLQESLIKGGQWGSHSRWPVCPWADC